MATGALIGAALAAGAMSAAGQLGGSAMNYLYSKKLMKRQVGYQKQLMSYQHQLNSPLQQVTDLRAAGLNPNLVYQGNPAMSTSIPSAPSGGNLHVDLDPKVDLVGALQAAQQIKTGEAQEASITANTAHTNANTDKLKVDTDIAKEHLKQEKVKTSNMEFYGNTSPTWSGLGVGLTRKGIKSAYDHFIGNPAKEDAYVQSVNSRLRNFDPQSHVGRSAMTNNGGNIESDAVGNINHQELPPGTEFNGRYVEGKPLYVDTDEERRRKRSEALKLERERRRRNGILDRQQKRKNDLLNHISTGHYIPSF